MTKPIGYWSVSSQTGNDRFQYVADLQAEFLNVRDAGNTGHLTKLLMYLTRKVRKPAGPAVLCSPDYGRNAAEQGISLRHALLLNPAAKNGHLWAFLLRNLLRMAEFLKVY